MTANTLDAAMNHRRLELLPPLRWGQVAQRAGMDAANLRRIRRGEIALTEFAAVGIDRALEWPKGQAWGIYHEASPGDYRQADDPASPSESKPAQLELRDDVERDLWALPLAEDLRREYIEIYRARKKRRQEDERPEKDTA